MRYRLPQLVSVRPAKRDIFIDHVEALRRREVAVNKFLEVPADREAREGFQASNRLCFFFKFRSQAADCKVLETGQTDLQYCSIVLGGNGIEMLH